LVTRLIESSLRVEDSLDLKGIDAQGKVFHRQTNAPSLSAVGTTVRVRRVLDKRGDKYVEELEFADGQRSHIEHPLTEHRGYGSDKPALRAQREAAKAAKAVERLERKRLGDAEYQRRTPTDD